MSIMKFNTIKDLYDAVKSGKVDESTLEIILDNDCTSFFNGPSEDNEIIVDESGGYNDLEQLYLLLFPKAAVEWC